MMKCWAQEARERPDFDRVLEAVEGVDGESNL